MTGHALRMSLRTGVLAALLPAVFAAVFGACASAPATPTTGVVIDPEAPQVTPHGDLGILRHRAAIGLTADVRAELAPRLAAVADRPGPDPGRDALRALAIELALIQGDADAARAELDRLDRTIAGQGERASAELRALAATLRGAWLFDAHRYADARSSHLRALVALDQQPPDPQGAAQKGAALRALARDQLALGEAEAAVNTLGKAIELHRDSPEAHIELHEDLLLAVDVMIAVQQPDEAVIVSSDAYNQALSKFGSDTLPHAEALLLVGAATLAKGDRSAAASVISDARAILDKLQSERSDPRFPISARALRRSDDLMQALAASPTEKTTSI